MATNTRKRGAAFLLEKPLVSRLPFEVEQHFSSAFPPPKRVKPAPTRCWRDDNLDKDPCTDVQSETSGMQEFRQREEVAAADVEVEVGGEKGCWLTGGRDKLSGGGEHEEKVRELRVAATGVPATGAAAGNSGPRRAMVQLKIDAMFAAPRIPPKETKDCSAHPNQKLELDLDAPPPGDSECAGATRKADRGMDVDRGVAGADAGEGEGEGEGGSSCYACRGSLGTGTEGGDVLCAFCDRVACQGCWQKCYACEVPHCSLCLAADYSSQFECFFCPPCNQDRRLESC